MFYLNLIKMKKSFLLIILATLLSTISAGVFAQSTNTAVTPMEGSTFTYTVNGLTQGDTYSMGINDVAGDLTHDASPLYAASAVSSQSVPAGGVVEFPVTWNTGSAAAGEFYLWIEITDQIDNCSIHRTLVINPIEAVDYNVNFNVLALSLDDGSITPAELAAITGGTSVEAKCPPIVGEDRVAESLGDVMDDGYMYAYFKVVRTASPDVESQWTFNPSEFSIDGGSATGNWEVSTDGASFTAMSAPQQFNSDLLYVRVQVDNIATDSDRPIVLNIGENTADVGGLETDANTVGANSATIYVSPLPTVGTFGIN
jgi:hypothetical protein